MGAAGASGGGAGNFAIALTDNSAYLRSIMAHGIAIDGVGNYFVVGKVWTSTRYGYIVKVDPVGTILQTARIDASSISFEAYAICIDTSDNVYIAGRANGNLAYIAKYNSSLSLQWVYEYTSTASGLTKLQGGYKGSVISLKTDSTDVFMCFAADISGTRTTLLRVACSDGDVVGCREIYSAGGTQQFYGGDVEVAGSYVYVGGFDETDHEAWVVGLNKSDLSLKSGTSAVTIDNSNRTSDARGLSLSKDANDVVYACTHWIDTSPDNRRRAAIVKFEGDSAFLQGDYNLYGTQQEGNSFLSGYAIPTNNSDNDVIIFGNFGHDSSTRKPTFMSVDNNLGSVNWMNYIEFSGTYHDGNESSYTIEPESNSFRSIQAVISKDGTHVVGISTLSQFDQDASNTNKDHIGIFSQKIDGTHSAPQDASLTVTTNGTTNTNAANPTQTGTPSITADDRTSTVSKTDKSSSFSINTSYSMYSDSVTF